VSATIDINPVMLAAIAWLEAETPYTVGDVEAPLEADPNDDDTYPYLIVEHIDSVPERGAISDRFGLVTVIFQVLAVGLTQEQTRRASDRARQAIIDRAIITTPLQGEGWRIIGRDLDIEDTLRPEGDVWNKALRAVWLVNRAPTP
jgi:hypothetical protein